MNYWYLIGIYATIKGTAIAVVTSALDIAFWKSLIIATLSGSIGAAGAILAAYIAVKETTKTRDAVRSVQRKLSANRREGDGNGDPR